MKTENRRIVWIVVIVLLSLFGTREILRRVMGLSRVPVKAMSPTIHPNDYVSVNRFAYRFGGKPRVGDVATYRYKKTRHLFRIVGGPGDTLQMQDNVLFRNGTRVSEPYIMLTPDIPAVRTFGPIEVPPDHYFFMGDNRDNANDSRFLGFVPENQILGRMNFVWHIGQCDDSP